MAAWFPQIFSILLWCRSVILLVLYKLKKGAVRVYCYLLIILIECHWDLAWFSNLMCLGHLFSPGGVAY